jgi:hypothetical protein
MRLNQLRKRSLEELDDVIEEILARNPDFMIELDKILDGDPAKPHRRNPLRRVRPKGRTRKFI